MTHCPFCNSVYTNSSFFIHCTSCDIYFRKTQFQYEYDVDIIYNNKTYLFLMYLDSNLFKTFLPDNIRIDFVLKNPTKDKVIKTLFTQLYL